MKKGLLITFEGSEGSGKSTQIKMLSSYLRRQGFRLLQLREPGSTVVGERIRQILLEPKNKQMGVFCEMLLYQAARTQLVREKILPALKQKKIVLVDRFLDATICYQGYAAGLDIQLIKQIGGLATSSVQPDLTILLDINAKEGLRRSKTRDRIERRPLAFHQRVRKGYLKLARQNPHRIKIVRVSKGINQTQAIIREIVQWRLGISKDSKA